LLEFARLVARGGLSPRRRQHPDRRARGGQALTSHPRVAHIAFTGGPETARHIVRGSAENLASTSLELGGKSPFIVFDDADLDSAANAQVSGIFAATGQSCVAGSRFWCSAVKDAFLARLKAKAEAIAIGAPDRMETEVGPLCTARQRDRIAGLIARSLAAGRKGGHRRQVPEGPGFYFPPTILDCSDAPDAPCTRNSSAPSCRSSPSTPRPRRWRWPMTPPTAWPRASSPAA
jgi:acyl-CoA reductase-like NAD-dependent aldehyde dehydrogenase